MELLINFENKNLTAQSTSKLIYYAISNRLILNINLSNFKSKNIIDFFDGNYQSRLIADNLDVNKIERVTNKLIELIKFKDG